MLNLRVFEDTKNLPEQIVDETIDVVVSGYCDRPNTIFLDRYVNDNFYVIGKSLMEIINGFREQTFANGHSPQNSLLTKNGLDYWLLSGVFENCSIRNPNLNGLVKTIAFQMLLRELEPSTINLHVKRGLFFDALKQVASSAKIPVKVFAKTSACRAENRVQLYFLRGLGRFIYELGKSIVKRPHKEMGGAPEAVDFLFIAYEENAGTAKDKTFQSLYWGNVTNLGVPESSKVQWVHLSAMQRNPLATRAIYKQLEKDQSEKGKGKHQFSNLDDFISSSEVIFCFLDYIKLYVKTRRLTKKIKEIDLQREKFYAFPFVEESWLRSTRGGTALSNLISIRKIENLLKFKEVKTSCFFLCEGMAWESALVYLWGVYQKSNLFAYIYSPWKSNDFRLWKNFVVDERLQAQSRLKLLVNNTISYANLSTLSVGRNTVQKVEAIRYRSLSRSKTSSWSTGEAKNTLLVILEGLRERDTVLLNILKNLLSEEFCFQGLKIIVRPHPGGEHVGSDMMESFEFSKNPEIEHDYDFADLFLTSINSSAALELSLTEKTTFYFLAPGVDVRSPLVSIDWSLVFSTVSELRYLLSQNKSHNRQPAHNPFYQSKDFLMWNELISSELKNG